MNPEDIAKMLGGGWEVAGYAVNITAAGAMAHSVLLRYGTGLVSITVLVDGDKEIGRTVNYLTPKTAPTTRKGIFD